MVHKSVFSTSCQFTEPARKRVRNTNKGDRPRERKKKGTLCFCWSDISGEGEEGRRGRTRKAVGDLPGAPPIKKARANKATDNGQT